MNIESYDIKIVGKRICEKLWKWNEFGITLLIPKYLIQIKHELWITHYIAHSIMALNNLLKYCKYIKIYR